MKWPLLSVPVKQLLATHYMERKPSVMKLYYEYDPDYDWEKRVEWVEQSENKRVARPQLTAVLKQYNKRYNNSSAVMKAIERLHDRHALVVIGGQQGGLFTGPLLVMYKAISLIRMAQEAESKLARPVIPVFWIAGEDHDFDEVDHTYVITAESSVQRIRIAKPDEQRSPVSHVRLDAGAWEATLHQLERVLPKTEFMPGLLAHLRAAATASASLSECFAIMMGRMFGRYGLVLIDSADVGLRALEAPMFEMLIQNNDQLKKTYDVTQQQLAADSYPIQAMRSPHSAYLFLLSKGERHLLYKENGCFVSRHRNIVLSEEQLLKTARVAPQQLSNDVLTRPLMQEYLFPVLATVLGAGEIAYWAQTKQAFRVIGMRMPIIWPRMSFTCIGGTLQKLLDKYDLVVEDVMHHFEKKSGLAASTGCISVGCTLCEVAQ